MTPKAEEFVKANDASPVIEGWVNEPDPAKPAKGGTYRLKNRKTFSLTVEDCRSLPDGYPRWDI